MSMSGKISAQPTMQLDFNGYKEWVRRRAHGGALDMLLSPFDRNRLLGAIGLAGEAGEVLELHKKNFYHGRPLEQNAIRLELGDVLWYFALLCDCYSFSLAEIIDANVAKLEAKDGVNSERFHERANPPA